LIEEDLMGKYNITTEQIIPDGQKIDVSALAAAKAPWWNGTLSTVNDQWVRLGVLEGDFHWHKHDQTDEFFYVLEGKLDLELGPYGRTGARPGFHRAQGRHALSPCARPHGRADAGKGRRRTDRGLTQIQGAAFTWC
jgi:hypothetical protein